MSVGWSLPRRRNLSLLEKDFEQVIFDSLRGSPLYVGFDDKDGGYTCGDYSKELHADLSLLAAYIEKTQPIAWKKLQKQFPGHEAAAVVSEINKLRPKRGLLKLLREGFSLAGVGKIELVTFKPATGFNPAHREKYEANRFAVVRQFHFSSAKPHDSIDLVILLNGLPLISMEAKNEFTGQTWQHAEQQYRKDRGASEPFLKACVVHFAVDNTTISMTTKLANGKTRFLPFNRDLKNPPIEGNFATAYLWESVLCADSLLDLLQNYLHLEEKTNEATGKVSTSLIFPRFHQMDCVRELLAEVREHGTGDNYLIQHSAGSGKSNTIAWLAHQLANLFTDDNQLVFDSVIIITDRQVLDKQLQETVQQFEMTAGLVQKIDKNTKQLVDALAGGAKIIVCTLQKFSWMRNVLGGPNGLKGKKFALIVDEAHSSQSGEGAKDLKLVLTTPEELQKIIAEDDENAEWTDPVAEELARWMKGRQRLPHLSFFAFTATPKTKTLEVFGKPREVVTVEGVKKVEHRAFHSYTMRQAIEEGFILDVLQNYTTYGTYFELLENEKAPPGYEVESAKGRMLLMKHVGKHPHTIESKAKIMLDHFFTKTVHKIGGEAKAMVVTSSRAHAVLYKQIIDRLLHEDYADQTQALVAFSGKVTIKGDKEAYTEEGMNPTDAKDIRAAFKKQKYRILIVANKFQTGFDQPLLHTMYVDKKLGGVATVQTLSRLNRKGPPAKQDTMVLDFTNTQEAVEADFQDYYGKTTLDRGTEPQKLYNLKFEVEELGVFTPEEVAEFAKLFVIEKAPGQKISPLFTKIIQGRFAKLSEGDQDRFRVALRRYVSQYSFVSQIINWIDPELEKFYLFTKLLLKYLPQKKDELPEEILNMVDMDKFRLEEKQNGSIVLNPADTEMKNKSGDGHGPGGGDKEKLEVIVKELNEKYHFDFEDRDKVLSIVIPKLAKDAGLIAAFQTNNLETLRKQKFADSLENAFISSAGDFYSVLNRMSDEPDFKRLLTEFALVEFKRGLKATSGAEAEANSFMGLAERSEKLLAQNFGSDEKWARINAAVWKAIPTRNNHALTLTEVDAIATTVSADPNDVLAVLALLSRERSGLLKMEYVASANGGVSAIARDEVSMRLQAWWKDRTMSNAIKLADKRLIIIRLGYNCSFARFILEMTMTLQIPCHLRRARGAFAL
jgi:type I restriction enzyme, R subunit